MDVAAWLRGLGLHQYERAFHENDIGPELLVTLTAADLRELGVLSLGHRKTLLGAISALAGAASGAAFGAETDPALRARPAAAMAAPPGTRAGVAGPPAPPAERRQLTVLFCDLADSTPLARRLDPEDFEGVIRRYQDVCAGVVARHDGRLFEFLGDGVLVHFGHPRAHEDDAERAVRAGLDLVEAVGGLAPPDGAALRARVGIATGLVVVGAAVGRDRGALGETPNLAARLQAVAAPGTVVVDAATRRLVEGLFRFGEAGPVAAKGFAAPVHASCALGAAPVGSRSEVLHSQAKSAPLVGRDQEVELLLHRWTQAQRGEGRVVLLSGEAGIGKSRIAAGLMARLADGRHTALQYFCSPHHQDSALFPVARQIEHAAGFERGNSPAAKLAKLDLLLSMASRDTAETALIADLLSIPPTWPRTAPRAALGARPRAIEPAGDPAGGPASGGRGGHGPPLPGLTPHKRKEKLLGALLGQLAGLASRRPVLALIEDAHWIDPTSLELLELAVERIRRLPVLLVVTFRPEFRPPWTGMSHVTALALGGLSRAEAAALVEQTAGAGALSPATIAGIVERTDGVPLFVEELTRAVAEADGHDIAARDAPAADASGGGTPGGALDAPADAALPRVVPAALHAPLMSRFDRLGPAKEVAQIGAAIGREFPYDLLAAVARLPGEALDAALDRLIEADMICRRGRVPWATFMFKHALVQDAAYGTLLRATRRELHARIARCIEAEFPEVAEAQPERLAQHCADADMVDEAVEYWSRAGRRAIARSGMREAAAHLRRAIALLARLPDGPARQRRELDLTTLLGTALVAAKGYPDEETGRAYARARALYEALGDTSRLTSVIRGQCSFHIARGEVPTVLSAAADLLAEADRQNSREMRLTAHQLLGIGVLYAGRLHEAREHLRTAADLLADAGGGEARFTNSKDALVGIPVYRALTLLLLGRYEAARAQDALSLAMARRQARPHRLAFALGMTVWFRTLLGEDGSRCLAELAGLSAEHGYPYWTGFVQVCQGLALCHAGDAGRGLVLAREGVARHEAMGATWSVPLLSVTVAAAVEGREADALPLVDDAFVRAKGTGVEFFAAERHRVKAKLLLASGDAAGAEAHCAEALTIARAQDARHWELRAATDLARLWRDRGRRAEAHELLAPVHAWFSDGADAPDLQAASAVLDGLGR